MAGLLAVVSPPFCTLEKVIVRISRISLLTILFLLENRWLSLLRRPQPIARLKDQPSGNIIWLDHRCLLQLYVEECPRTRVFYHRASLNFQVAYLRAYNDTGAGSRMASSFRLRRCCGALPSERRREDSGLAVPSREEQ